MYRTQWAAAFGCAAWASASHAADTPARSEPSIVVIGERRDAQTPEKLDHIMPEVDGTKITVTKKTSVTKLDLLPTITDTTISASSFHGHQGYSFRSNRRPRSST